MNQFCSQNGRSECDCDCDCEALLESLPDAVAIDDDAFLLWMRACGGPAGATVQNKVDS